MSLAPRKPGFYIPLRKHISPDCKRDILFRRGTQIQAGDSLGAACYKRLIPAAKAKAVNHTRDIPQTFWRDDRLPWLELRSTGAAAGPISATATPSSRWGRLSRGNALPVRWPGVPATARDLIVIPPHAPHSCNPLHGRPRSYHMLYLDVTWCRAQRRIFPWRQYRLAAAAAARQPSLCQFPAGCRPDEPREP